MAAKYIIMTTILVPNDLRDVVIATRRTIHMHPELGFEELETSKLVASRLRKLGFEVHTVPACFYALGAQGSPSTANPHHSGTFDIDARALEVGVQMMTALAPDAPRTDP